MGLSGLLWNNPMTASTAFSDRANYKKHIQKNVQVLILWLIMYATGSWDTPKIFQTASG